MVKMTLGILRGVGIILGAVVALFHWANQPVSMNDSSGGRRLAMAFVVSPVLLFFGVVALIAIAKLRNSNWKG
jgi:hypothetical protein